jgi:glutamate-ammonia-ligase adenylyltransferase
MTDLLTKSLQKLPNDIHDLVAAGWEKYQQALRDQSCVVPVHTDFITSLCRVWASSDFVMNNCVRYPHVLLDLFESGDILLEYPKGEYEKKLALLSNLCRTEAQLQRCLREFRRREMLRIAWRDLANWASPDKTMTDLSAMADTIISRATQLLFTWLSEKMGCPRDPDTQARMPLLIIAMGKLGAYELNFSSDVDLIYCFPKDGILESGKTFHQFYLRLGQMLTKMLHTVNQHGFVYRVDLRLRPHGTSGALVCSFAAFEDYYQAHGREWERYALIKARVVNRENTYSPALMRFIHNFVYRNYIDYSALESLRLLQDKINLEVKRHSLENNIKRGPGGIREVEFISQTYKIIRGGKQLRLQERNTLKSLILLRENRNLSPESCRQLMNAYLFERDVENKLQMVNDQQTHVLPSTPLQQQRLSYAMHHINYKRFCVSLQRHRQAVQHYFEEMLARPQLSGLDKNEAKHEKRLQAYWKKLNANTTNTQQLTDLGFTQAQHVLELLISLQEYITRQNLSQIAKTHANFLLPRLLIIIGAHEAATELLKRTLRLIEAIIEHSIYLVFLIENPLVLSQAVNLCAASPWIAEQLARYPLLLDELLDPSSLYAPPSLRRLRVLLNQQLNLQSEADLEQKLQVVRWFKQAHVLRVAAADITGTLPLMHVSDYLTNIATVVVDKVRELILFDMVKTYGNPQLPRQYRRQGFTIVAYGKLGGLELSYSSDLDLLFLHPKLDSHAITDGENSISNEKFYTRLGQRIVKILNQPNAGGFLYEADLRLRPSGSSGVLVSCVDAFATYQTSEAWTWEHQALVRARAIAGSKGLGKRFEKLRNKILATPRPIAQLREAIVGMRNKMRDNKMQRAPGKFDLKQGIGGLVDIEFLAQYVVLCWSQDHPSLLEFTDNIRIFERAGMEGLLRIKDTKLLIEAYKAYRSYLHRTALSKADELVDDNRFIFYRIGVARLWEQIFIHSEHSHDKMPPTKEML